MAQLPTIDEVIMTIFSYVKTNRPGIRPGEMFSDSHMRTTLFNIGYRAADLNPAIAALLENGLIEPAIPGHFRLTEAGFKAM